MRADLPVWTSGGGLERPTLVDAVRKLVHSCGRLSPALSDGDPGEPAARQGRSELAAAAASLLRQLEAADDTASTELSWGLSDGSRSRAADGSLLLGSLLSPPARLSPLPPDQMAARLRQAVSQLESSPSKSSLRTPDSPQKGRVQFSRPAERQ